MKLKLIASVVGIGAFGVIMFVPNRIEITPNPEPTIEQQLNIKPRSEELLQVMRDAAKRYKINAEEFIKVAQCESSLVPSIIGDGGFSVGLFQIHLPSHPDVTKEQAINPFWASEWAARKYVENPNIWTCYRNIYGRPNQTVHR